MLLVHWLAGLARSDGIKGCSPCIITHQGLIPTTESAKELQNPKPYNPTKSPNINTIAIFFQGFQTLPPKFR